MTKSQSTTRRTARLQLDMLVGAVSNAEALIKNGAYRGDPAKQRATYELRDAGKLILALLEDTRVNGAMTLGKWYVDERGAQFAEYNNRKRQS